MPRTTSMLEHALAYARAGLPVLPLHSVLSDGSCSCGAARCHSPGKHPRTMNGVKDATTDEKQIRKWWGDTRWPSASIGGCGGDFLCLDIDAKRDGFVSLERLIEAHAALPETAAVATGETDGQRGRHYWFRVPEDVATPGTRAGVRDGIDIRCAGGYAVLPPSVHASGITYEWEWGSIEDVVEAPQWVLELAPEYVEYNSAWTPDPNFRMSKNVKQFLSGELEVPIGEQRKFLLSAARSVLTTGRDVETTADLLWHGTDGSGGIENCEWQDGNPWTPEGVYALVSDIFRKPPTSPMLKDFTGGDFTLDDTGNAERLIASFPPDHVIYTPELDQWFVWNEERTHFQRKGEDFLMLRWADITVELMKQVQQARSESEAAALMRHAKTSRMQRQTVAAVRMSRAYATVHERELNVDPWLFQVANGIIDLRTGELEATTPAHRVTRLSQVEYNARAKSALFDSYLKRTIPDEELRDYVQMACGYTLTGSTDEDAFFYLHGRPGTGKSTLMEAIRNVMGTYAMTADTSSFMRSGQRSQGPSEDLARLTGARLVVTGEVEKGERLAAALVSRITGGDPIAARMLYGKTFEYAPRFKLWIHANELPKMVSSRSGIWRRVKVLSFDQVLDRDAFDPLLRSHKIKEPKTAEAVLLWAVEGAVKWYANYKQGHTLKEPAVVTQEVTKFKRESDHVITFTEDALAQTGNDHDRVPVHQLYDHYRAWCNREGRERRLAQRQLAVELADMGFKSKVARHEDKAQRCWIGVMLNSLDVPGGVNIKGATKRRGAAKA